MIYVDVETTPEALQEDEELIEVVNEIVEIAATAIYTDIKNDVSGVLYRIRFFLDSAFPFLVDWREDPTIFARDMKNLGLSFLLYSIAFWILSPSRHWSVDKRQQGKKRNRGHLASLIISDKQSVSLEQLRKKLAATFNKEETVVKRGTLSPPKKRPTMERSRSTSSIAGMNRRKFSFLCFNRQSGDEDDDDDEYEEEEEESEEEKFAKRWPEILKTRYCQLVLPPECKRVEKPRNKPKPESEARKTASTSKVDGVAKPESGSDDENPANRLLNYTRHFLHFFVSMLRYDYFGAGWTLIYWIEWWIRTRRNRHSTRESEMVEDDESEAGDGSLVRQLSFNSVQSAASTGSSSRSTSRTGARPLPRRASKGKTRSKRDSVLKPQRLTPVEPEMCSDTIDPLPRASLALSDEEEKKDSIDSNSHEIFSSARSCVTPPPTPPASNRVPHPDSVYETPRLDLRDKNIDLGDALVSKLALSSRTNQQLNSLPKPKDALESYRKPSLRPKPMGPPGGVPPMPTFLSASSPARNESIGENSTDGITETTTRLDVETEGIVQERNESYYFEAASTQEHLKKMSVEVPVPDRNGYIIGDEFLPDSSYWMPLLVFVNSRSGPQQGHLLIAQLRGLLNPIQVWDLADGSPKDILESFTNSFTRLRILVCGGDGTISWIVSTMEQMKLQRKPPIAILPLGTGNDLARIHGWGGGYNNEPLTAILEQVAESYISLLDRWEMTIENKKGKVKEVKSFFNYLGVGADAQAALQVHLLRESRPQLFFSRVVNKAWYGVFGAEDILKATSVNLPHEITLIADGVEVPLPSDSQGIILLNIDSYAGGVPLWSLGSKGDSLVNSPVTSRSNSWANVPLKRSRSLDLIKERKSSHATESPTMNGVFERVDSVEDLAAALSLSDEENFLRVTACNRPSSCQDGILDVVSIRGAFHLGQIRVGLSNAQKLCQCREATIIIKRKVSVQIDGEPWRQNICTLRVKRKKDAAIMLHRSADDSNGVETEMANLLDWAEERKLIDDRVHSVLMKEFSRRIESKTRQRREQSRNSFSLKRAMASTGSLGPGSSAIMF